MGPDTNRIFPWVVSDFGLTDAIESGLVKIPQLAVRDTTGADIPATSTSGDGSCPGSARPSGAARAGAPSPKPWSSGRPRPSPCWAGCGKSCARTGSGPRMIRARPSSSSSAATPPSLASCTSGLRSTAPRQVSRLPHPPSRRGVRQERGARVRDPLSAQRPGPRLRPRLHRAAEVAASAVRDLETKGFDPLEEVKTAAARRWVAAVNSDGTCGRWRYELTKRVTDIPALLSAAANPSYPLVAPAVRPEM